MELLTKQLDDLYEQKDQIEKQIKQLENKLKKESSNSIILKDAIYIDKSYIPKHIIKILKDAASFENPQIKIMQGLRRPAYNIPKYIKSYEEDQTTLVIPRGLMRNVIEVLKQNHLNTVYLDKRFVKKSIFKKIKFEPKKEQIEAIENILKKDFSLCIAPPGFGKTYIGAKIIEQREVNTLVIVNKNMLLDQWCDRFVQYFGFDKKEIGYLGKGKNKLNGTLDVATMQSLKNNTSIIKGYSFVIVDECHHIPALTFEKIIKEFQGKYILGLSATPDRKDGMQPLIYQQLGSVAYEAKSKRKNTNILKIVESEFISNADNFSDLISDIINNDYRNELIVRQIKNYQNRKTLVLTDRIEHIENLELILKYNEIDFISIHGSMKKDIQQKHMSLVENSSLVLATTSFFGEGIDFPHLNTIIFATPISYYGRLVQYLGRIGRGGDDCIAVDILDIKNKFALSSYKKRKDGYKQLHYRRVDNK